MVSLDDALRHASPEEPWLALGRRAARLLRSRLEAEGQVGVVRNVHEAVEALGDRPWAGLVASSERLSPRRREALRVLVRRLGARPLVEVRAGLPVAIDGALARGRPAPPRPERELPRADAVTAATTGLDPFARGLLERQQAEDPRRAAEQLETYLLETLRLRLGAARASLLRVLPDGHRLGLVRGVGLPPGLVGVVHGVVGRGVAGTVAASGRPATGRATSLPHREYAGQGYVILPLGAGPDLLGVVCLTDLPRDDVPDEPSLALASQMASVGAEALRVVERIAAAESLARRDALTGLPNRRAFEEAVAREEERARRGGGGFAIAVYDVDRFKQVNDRYGHHPAGDAVLRAVASRLEDAFRQADLVARWGGEEFAALLTGVSADVASEVFHAADRARSLVRRQEIELGPGLPRVRATVSAGVALYPVHGRTAASVFEAADRALYAAKSGGRDRVELPGSPGA